MSRLGQVLAERRPRHADTGMDGRWGWSGFAAATYALLALLIGSNIPTPLFPVYARVFGLSPLGITLLFATYTLLVVPALLVFGALSDVKGRRETLLPSIVLAIAAAAVFAAANQVVWLFVAQVVEAAALGALQGTAAPTLVETDPTGDTRRASGVASATTVGGAAIGPLLAGLLAQYAPLPRRLVYLVEVGLLMLAFAVVCAALPARQRRERWHPRRPTVPAEIRSGFVTASVSAFVAWAVTGLFLSLIPSFITETLSHHNLALAGGVVAVMLGTSAVVQVVGQRLPSASAQIGGLVVMLAGVIALIVTASARSLLALFVATPLAGAGQGLAFMGALGDINEIAPPERKGDTVATFYVVVYLATALPVVGVGALSGPLGLLHAVGIFGYLIAAVCLIGLIGLVFRHRRGWLA